MGIFYNPPSPPSGTNAATPPEPHIPIAKQGDPPPRRQTAAVLAIVAVLASWPADLEPRLTRPNDQRQTIAPLTLTYGQQPPRRGFLTPPVVQTLVASWPLDLEPRYDRTNEQQQKIAPLTLTYGQQPSRVGTSLPTFDETISSQWPLDLEPRLGRPNDQRQKIAPLKLPYGTPPQPQAPLSTIELAQIVGTWPTDVGPTVPWPDWVQRTSAVVAVQTPVSQPPRVPALSAAMQEIIAAWPTDVGPSLPYAPPRAAAITAQPTVSQPPIGGPITVTELTQLVGTWAQTWDAQSAAKNAGWNVAPLVSRPYTPLPRLIWTAWEPPWIQPPTPVSIAPLTLPTGQQPPGIAPAAPSALSAWLVDPPASQGPSRSAATLQPAFVPYTRLPAWAYGTSDDPLPIRRATTLVQPGSDQPPRQFPLNPATLVQISVAWIDPPPAPPRPVQIVPLTLTYGSAPPQRPLLSALLQIVGAWPVDVGPVLPFAPQRTAGVASQPRVDQPPIAGSVTATEYAELVATWPIAWDAQTAGKSAAWNVPPVVAYVPYLPLARAILIAWEPAWVRPPVPVAIVTLTLPTGNTPPAKSALDRQIAAAAAWTPDVLSGPRLPSVAGWSAPTQVPVVAFPLAIRAAWDEPFLRLPSLTPIASLLPASTVPRSNALPLAILRAWHEDVLSPWRQVRIAPLTLARGDAPPVRSALTVASRTSIWTEWLAQLEQRLPGRLWAFCFGTPASPRVQFFVASYTDAVFVASATPALLTADGTTQVFMARATQPAFNADGTIPVFVADSGRP